MHTTMIWFFTKNEFSAQPALWSGIGSPYEKQNGNLVSVADN